MGSCGAMSSVTARPLAAARSCTMSAAWVSTWRSEKLVSSKSTCPASRDDCNKVLTKGDINRTPGQADARTLAEEVVGTAWGYDGPPELGTPMRLYLQVVLNLLDQIEAARPGALQPADDLAIIAGVGIAMADAGIDAWFYKYQPTPMMWRPAVGIRQAVQGNGQADPGWVPLGRPDTNG